MVHEFVPFEKIPRLSRECIISEKIDGTNGVIFIPDTGDEVFVGSRSRWITPNEDNHGFAKWAEENKTELLKLGPGRHFGEWWGSGIQRGYGLPKGEKRFSLFNTTRWAIERPACCHLVPMIDRGILGDEIIIGALNTLISNGSFAAPGFMKPEGIIIYHVAGNLFFKKTIDNDEEFKGK